MQRRARPCEELRAATRPQHTSWPHFDIADLFPDLQEWDLIPRKFDPVLSMVTSKSLIALIGPTPSGHCRRHLGKAGLGRIEPNCRRRPRISSVRSPVETPIDTLSQFR